MSPIEIPGQPNIGQVTGQSPITEDTSKQLLPRNNYLRKISLAYEPFMKAMDLAYGLRNIPAGNLRWADIAGLEKKLLRESLTLPPKVLANPGFDHPKLAVALIPKDKDEKNVTGDDTYHAPILIRDVNRWRFSSQTLGNYVIDGWSGAEAGKEMFSEPHTLAEILKDDNAFQITDSTPVVEAIAVIPIAEDGSFRTEFAPQIRFDTGDHEYYKVGVVSQNKLSKFVQLINGHGVYNVQAIEPDQSMHHFRADFIPDMDEVTRLFVPSSAGHMILIASPFKRPKPKYDFGYGGRGFDYDSPMKGGGSDMFMGGTRGGGLIGGVDIGIGSKTGTGSLFEGELAKSREGTATIFHIRVIGVKPQDFEKLGQQAGQLGSAIDAYASKN